MQRGGRPEGEDEGQEKGNDKAGMKGQGPLAKGTGTKTAPSIYGIAGTRTSVHPYNSIHVPPPPQPWPPNCS